MTQHNSNLSLNQQGRDVALLQSRLLNIGYTIATSEILSETFGQSTYQAVLQFQQRGGLQPTGVVDPLTAQALMNRFEADKTVLMSRPSSASDPMAQLLQPLEPPHAQTPISPMAQPPEPPHMQPAVQPPGPPHAQAAPGQPDGHALDVIRSSTPPIQPGQNMPIQPGQGLPVHNPGLQQPPPDPGGLVLQPGAQQPLPVQRGPQQSVDGPGTPLPPKPLPPGGPHDTYTVSGHATDANGEILPNATVVALGIVLRASHELGRAVTDASGSYSISYPVAAPVGAMTDGNGSAGTASARSASIGIMLPPLRNMIDLQVELLSSDGSVALASPILYNAPQQATIDLALGGPRRAEPSEFSRLTSTLTPLLGNLAPTDLREDTQFRDLSFLEGQSSIAKPHIALWSIASHMSSSTKLPPQLFYALLRNNVPANAETIALASSTQGTDLASNAQLLQDALLSTKPATLEQALNSALANNLLPASYADSIKADLAQLHTLANTAALNSIHGMGKTSIATVMNALSVTSETQQHFIELYANTSSSDLRSFWSKLLKNPAFTKQQVGDLHFGIIVGRITRGHLPLLTELVAQRSSGKITHARDLARLTAADWLKLLQTTVDGKPIGAPANLTAATAAQAPQRYALMLENGFTLAYPTTAFSARLQKDTQSSFHAGQAVSNFLDTNLAFELPLTNIDAYAQKTPISADVRSTLLVAQRLAKLDPFYTTMNTLFSNGIHSSGQIYKMGRSQFIEKYSENVAIGPTLAARIYAKAEQTYGVALALVGRTNQAFAAGSPAAIASLDQQQLSTKLAAFPNLQTLFGSDSFCACDDCQSVLGDAAYLVDLLEFLSHRSTGDGSNARDVLLARRPDIAQLELSCPNTNTALPYIDLVNELLEDAVAAPPVGDTPRDRQTTLTTPELNANPQYTNTNAYARLAQANTVFPWTLPFDFPLAEARAYLGQLGLDRAQLVRAFQKNAGYPSSQARLLAVETLGLSALEADIITAGPLAASNHAWDYWGLAQNSNNIVDPYDPTKTVSGAWIDVLTQTRVFLTRAHLTYQELTRLLNTRFINNDGTVSIVCTPPDSCDVATMTMKGLTQDVLERIQRFVRLWRRLGWNIYDLDDAIWTLQNATPNPLDRLNDQLLRQLAVIVTLSKKYTLPVRQVVAFFLTTATFATIPTRDIPTLPGDDLQNSLYHDLFANLTILNPTDPVFALNVDGTEIAAISSHPLLADHSATLTAALQISNSDLNLAISTFTDGHLTLANLSAIYRNVQLTTLLGITLSELLSLLALAEAPIDAAPHYERVSPFDGTRPEALLTLIATYQSISSSGLSIEQLDYILRGVSTETSGVAPDSVMVGTLLLLLRNGLSKIAAQTTFSADPTGATTRKELAKLLSKANVDTTRAILAGTSTLSTADQNTFISTTLGSYLDATAAQTQLVGGAALAAGEARYEYMLQHILTYERQTLGRGLVIQTLGQALNLSSAITADLLTGWFPSVSNPAAFAIDDLLALPTLPLSDTSDPILPTNAPFVPYFTLYGQLAKTALLITSLNLSTDDYLWWHHKGVGLGWINPTTLPTSATATAQGNFASWNRLLIAKHVRDTLPTTAPGFATAFDLADNATPPPTYLTKAQYMTKLTALTQWPADALKTFCGDPANAGDQGLLTLVYPDDFVCERALARLLPCFHLLTTTGIPADVSTWIGATVSATAADAIKQSVKANYPLTQWLTLAKQLRDGLRESQRDALVAYLLAQAPPNGAARWLDPNDVFAWFLIDVEMGACQETSRMVQATAAVQLFVQRCFLGLEPHVKVKVVDDKDGKGDQDWLQWKWMSAYRVWQANREVFLFPENWLDPTLRSDKSPFFSDLERALKQNDLTNDTAESALENYLESLEAVARLDVCGTFHDMENDHDLLHVLARTQGSPPIYYTRQWVDAAVWTAWQKVDLDIIGDHVLPIAWNGKPYIFWAILNVKPDQTQPVFTLSMQASSDPPKPPQMHLEVQLAWSQFKQNKWQAKQTAPQVLTFQGVYGSSDLTLKSSFNGSMLEIDLFLNNTESSDHVAAFVLGGPGSGVEAYISEPFFDNLSDVGAQTAGIGLLNNSLMKPSLWAPTDSIFDGEWIAPNQNSEHFLSSARLRVGPMYTTYDLYGALPSEVVFNQADYYRLVTPHQTPTFDSTLPFFYRDGAREYFCVATDYYKNGNYFNTTTAPAYVYDPLFRAEYRFWPFYHAFVPLFVKQLNMNGIPALYARDLQLNPAPLAGEAAFDFQGYYQPTDLVLRDANNNYPSEGVDFDPDAGYALYNWELFFHAPFLMAELLTNNQRFAEAKQWYEYIFNPGSATSDPIPQRFWITAPFFNMSGQDYFNAQIDNLMKAINIYDSGAEHQVTVWRRDPFDPDIIAQLRPVAYQRAIVMKYIDNLIKWGDQLFRQDTMESINQATQLYVLANVLLGPRPQIVPPRVEPVVKTYADLEGKLDDFSNEVVAAENAIPPVRVNVPTQGNPPPLPSLNTFYFRIPANPNLLTYWDTVEDRLFKIRHCMNIQGVVQQLPLFAPPISPGLLIAAAAAGLDLGSVLSDSNAAVPPYRFTTMIRHALEMCEQVRGLGGELLQVLEKSDAENLARIRSGSAIQLQSAIADVRNRQIDEAGQRIDALTKSKQASLDRIAFYQNRSLMNIWEGAALLVQGLALIPQTIAIALETTATVGHAVPAAQFGASGIGGTPHASVVYGGQNVGHGANSAAKAMRITAAILQTGAQMSAVMGQYQQRKDEWDLQATLATDESAHIDSEVLAATIHKDVATKELNAQNIAVTEAANVDAFLHSKFTNQELYDWMVGEISTTYFQAYQLAYALAKQAEQCFRRELALTDDNFYIQFGYWDSLRKGLTAAEKLQYDLRRLESAYYTQNARELELTKHVSLAQLDPYALIELRNNHTCLISLPELLFDLDNPGHYLRRLKSVAVTIPCVVGPYGGVSLTLSLLDNHIRVSTDTGGGYPGPHNPNLFIDDLGGTNEIVTSSAQNDTGLFELRFEDERYLPFEGSGAISNWRLTLNNVYPQFDYSTITDVVLHLRYTARDGGSAFASTVTSEVKAQLNAIALAESRKGLYRMVSARQEYGTAWARFLNPGSGNDQVLNLPTPPERFPFYTSGLDLKVTSIDVLAKTSDSGDYTLVVTPPGGSATSVTFAADATLGGVHHWENLNLSPKIDLGKTPSSSATLPTWSFKLKKSSATDFRSLTATDLDDLVVIVGYQVS